MVELERLPLPGIRLVTAIASMPINTASILKSAADAAEVQVALLRRLEELGGTVTVLVGILERPARALEPGMVRLARVLDTDAVEQTVTALPPLLHKLQEWLDALLGSLPALGQVLNQQRVSRVSGLLDRLAGLGPGLADLPDVEMELGSLRETLDRLVGLMSDSQRAFGSLLGASSLGRGGGGDEEETAQALAADTASVMATQPTTTARTPAPAREEPAEPAPVTEKTAGPHQPPARQPK
jgi:cell division septation protein DedD